MDLKPVWTLFNTQFLFFQFCLVLAEITHCIRQYLTVQHQTFTFKGSLIACFYCCNRKWSTRTSLFFSSPFPLSLLLLLIYAHQKYKFHPIACSHTNWPRVDTPQGSKGREPVSKVMSLTCHYSNEESIRLFAYSCCVSMWIWWNEWGQSFSKKCKNTKRKFACCTPHDIIECL